MTKYAAKTDVSSDRSRSEIEKTLRRYGATGFMYGWDENAAVVAFKMNARKIQFTLPLPDPNSREFTHTETGKPRRQSSAIEIAYEQAVKQKWRALALVIKAKLEAVESDITQFEKEFLAHIVLPGGQTVGEVMLPQIELAYDTGKMPPLLPPPK